LNEQRQIYLTLFDLLYTIASNYLKEKIVNHVSRISEIIIFHKLFFLSEIISNWKTDVFHSLSSVLWNTITIDTGALCHKRYYQQSGRRSTVVFQLIFDTLTRIIIFCILKYKLENPFSESCINACSVGLSLRTPLSYIYDDSENSYTLT
jgi:hypothetical protein